MQRPYLKGNYPNNVTDKNYLPRIMNTVCNMFRFMTVGRVRPLLNVCTLNQGGYEQMFSKMKYVYTSRIRSPRNSNSLDCIVIVSTKWIGFPIKDTKYWHNMQPSFSQVNSTVFFSEKRFLNLFEPTSSCSELEIHYNDVIMSAMAP